METPSKSSIVQCPVCYKRFPSLKINNHVNSCLGDSDEVTVIDDEPNKTSKKRKAKSNSPPSHNSDGWGFMMTSKYLTKRAKNVDTVVIDVPDPENVLPCTDSDSKQTKLECKPTISASVKSPVKSRPVTDIENLAMPLAEYMRPTSLDMYVGQEKVVGGSSILGSLLETKFVPSLILWGPPGCGKTTLAKIIANTVKDNILFKKLSAVNSGVKDVSEVVKQAKNDRKIFRKKTILFLDEIHRFNKTQQDSLLPHIEDGSITLIGATTENPSFQINNALLSRCKVIILEKLDCEALSKILISACEKLGYQVLDTDEESCDLGIDSGTTVKVQKPALEYLSQICDGDARIALNGLQMSVQSQMSISSQSKSLLHQAKDKGTSKSCVIVKTSHVKQSLQKSHIAYDKTGEEHYNMLSAFHKSIRGCADSAALYWLARMLEGGEPAVVVARRMVACATEDIGLADPQAMVLALAAFQACQFLGMPECEKALAECAVYLARAPKSVEVYMAYNKAKACVWEHEGPLPSVPLHLRNASNKFLKNLGYGKGYKSSGRDQEFLPETMKGTDFFKENTS